MNILGINSAYHESSACLIQNGKITAAVEEERFNRIKHGKAARVDNPQILPAQAITYCLAAGKITWDEVDHVGFAYDPQLRRANIGLEPGVNPADWGGFDGEETFQTAIAQIPSELSKLGMTTQTKFHWLKHHLCHAGSSFFVSPFETAAILTIDGIGEFSTTHAAIGQGNKITPLWELNYPNSLGFLWEKLSRFIGFSEYDACKVMGLAAYGNAKKVERQMQALVQIHPDGFTVNGKLLNFRQFDDYSGLESILGKKRGQEPLTAHHTDIAAGLQAITEQAILALVHKLHNTQTSPNLCLAGGVSLNCRATQIIRESNLFENIYVQPAANDAGTAIGAAFLLWCQLLGKNRPDSQTNAYLGPEYSEAHILKTIRSFNLDYQECTDIVEEVAQLLANGNIVAWFQGRMEIGPRALGNRSLLADPRDPLMRENLNRKVKHREDFRPFGPSICEEAAATWFKIPKKLTRGSPEEFMLSTCLINPVLEAEIPAVSHVDHTSRIQIVRQKENPKYHALIARFGDLTGVPLLLNTSFNDSEPIVCSPSDAIKTFLKTKIDYLVLGNYLINRKNL